MKLRLSIICLFFWTVAFAAADVIKCDICGVIIHGKYYHMEDRAAGGIKNVCAACSKLEERCFECNLPVKDGFQTLPDGRLLCARDAKIVIQSEADAREVCEQTVDALDRLMSRFMTFPGTNALVSIVNRFYLENLFKTPGPGQACVSIYGATTSNRLPGDKIVHSVAILSHLRKAELMAVCAHEYTHAWMGENVSRERTAALDKDTLEAFCELVAYKLMSSRNETLQMDIIRKNDYTKGKIDVLIAADSQYGFDAVMEWIKAGDDATLETDSLARIRAVSGHYVSAAPLSSALVFGPVASKVSSAPAALVLKGISGSGSHKFALINDATFEVMEKGKVRFGQTNLTVRCLEINNDSVTIQIDGAAEKKQLFLRPVN